MEQPTVTDAQPAASSPAPVRAEALVQSFTDSERTSWEKTGALPDRVKIAGKPDASADSSSALTSDAASSAAEPAKQVASTEASPSPASEAGKGPKEKGAKARIAELDAEIERDRAAVQERLRTRALVREELAALERPHTDARPDSSTGKATTQADWERFAAMPDAPQEDQFTSVRDYTIAMSLFVADKRQAERDIQTRQTEALTRHTESVKKTIADAAARIEKFREVEPNLEEKIDPALTEVVPASLVPKGQPIQPHHALMENILRSDFTAQLLIHFSTPEGKAEWGRLCALGAQSPDAFLRAFGRVEARVEHGSSAAATPAPKHVSDAPTPPAVLGNRTAETTDAVESAIQSKDVGRYIREANKRELAGLRG